MNQPTRQGAAPAASADAGPHHAGVLAAAGLTLALLLQGCGLLPSFGSAASASSSTPSPAGPPSSDADRASGKAPLMVGTRTGREAALAIEQAMDASDIAKLGSVLSISSSAAPQAWRNPKSGRDFTVTPMRGFAGDQGICREFSVDVTATAGIERLTGAACQGADQRWRVLR